MAVNPLNIALSGLRAAQSQISVTSNNIANVSTDGYTRKTLQQYTTVIGGDGAGVRVGQMQRRIDQILLRDYRSQVSTTAGLETRQEYLDQVQQMHGSPDSEISISAEMGKLKNSFSQLANQPESSFLLRNVYDRAQQMAFKFNDFSNRLTDMRNDTQADMELSISTINSLTKQIADLNSSISLSASVGRASPDLEDQRDVAVRELAKQLDLSYYTDQSNTLVVMTKNGQLLADNTQVLMYFNSTPVGPSNYYPVNAGAIRLGNPTTGVDLTADSQLGSKLGALVDLRDNILPTYQAQIDELAHKTALRFDSQGLRLFSLPDGTIPANNPVSYTGFAANIAVNPAIDADLSLLRNGTNPLSTVQDGSSEVLRKIVEFAFGTVQYEQITGTVDISNTVPTLFTTLSLSAQARMTGTANIQALGSLDSSPYINPGTNDNFTIQVGAGVPVTITITAGQTASDLVNTINTAIPGMAVLGAGGQLVLTAAQNITIGAGTLGASGLTELGMVAGTTNAVNPSFEIGIGNNVRTSIEIEPTDTVTQLLAKLNAVAGLDASLNVNGELVIVPEEGGDITTLDGLGSPLAALGAAESNVNHTAFNVTGLGPAASLDGRIQNGTNLHDYASQAVSIQSQDALNIDTSFKTEDNYRATLEREYIDTTGVNLDEEMANLIAIQNAYTASARAISAVEEMMDELMNTFR